MSVILFRDCVAGLRIASSLFLCVALLVVLAFNFHRIKWRDALIAPAIHIAAILVFFHRELSCGRSVRHGVVDGRSEVFRFLLGGSRAAESTDQGSNSLMRVLIKSYSCMVSIVRVDRGRCAR